jgi:hypothetical protein
MKIEVSEKTVAIAQAVGSIWFGLNALGLLVAYAPNAWWSWNLVMITATLMSFGFINAALKLSD